MKKLLQKGEPHLTPLKHSEYNCPSCGGIATITRIGNIVTAECHACGKKEQENVVWTSNLSSAN